MNRPKRDKKGNTDTLAGAVEGFVEMLIRYGDGRALVDTAKQMGTDPELGQIHLSQNGDKFLRLSWLASKAVMTAVEKRVNDETFPTTYRPSALEIIKKAKAIRRLFERSEKELGIDPQWNKTVSD